MELAKEDKVFLVSLGYEEHDLPQIEAALHASRTTYSLDGEPITRTQALQLLGRESYLAGISRSAFHYTAEQTTENGEAVGFDSYKLFELGGSMTNQKYEITDIVHGEYPFLHRIRALRNIGKDVKVGDLGGFVEHEENLSFEPGDDAWIYDDTIAAGDSIVDKGSVLRVRAVICGHAYASHGSVLFGDARAEDDAYLRGATMWDCARASGTSVIVASPDDPARAPRLSGRCAVYGKVMGDVHLLGSAVVISGEEVCSTTPDGLILDGKTRTVVRSSARDVLRPRQPEAAERTAKSKRKEPAR